MDSKFLNQLGQVLNIQKATFIRGEPNRKGRGNLDSLLIIIFLILFGVSTVGAATCTYTISPTSQSFCSNGGTDSITVTTQSGCSWSVTESLDWVSLLAGRSGTGSGMITYSVSLNDTGQPRKGAITIGNQTFTIRQAKSVFKDATDPTYWAYPYIYAIYMEGITVGCKNNEYCPLDKVTRGQMAAFIIRSSYGENFNYTTTPYFTDVPSANVFFRYVQKLKDVGITAVSGTYDIDGYVTRGQMAAFIIRALYGENFEFTTSRYFSDVPTTNVFFKYIQRLKEDGITTVTGKYDVDSIVTREQMAAFISRAFLVPEEASATIGPVGGTVEVTNSSSSLYGVKVDVPAGALSKDTNIGISIKKCEHSLPADLRKVSPMITLTPEGTSFNIPVTISIPFDSKNVTDVSMLGVYTYDQETSPWVLLTLKEISAGVIKALAVHLSDFQVAEYTKPLSNSGDSAFRASKNGFSVENFSDDKDPAGHCWGMAAFASWYWIYKQSEVNLSTKYSECQAKNVIDETQHIIVEIRDNLHQDPAYVANALMAGIDLGRPQTLSSFTNSPPGHAVLVYKYVRNSDLSINFYIYDPNPGAAKRDDIFITYKAGKFESYDSYNGYQFVGGLYSVADFESIYRLEMMPKIGNVSPSGTISSNRPTISATVTSGLRDIDKSSIEMTLDGKQVVPTVNGSGRSVTVSYTPNADLNAGDHSVSLNAHDAEEIDSCSKDWTFHIRDCVNIAGNWNYTDSGTVTCTVDGESETVSPSGSGIIAINQNGCNISWTEPVYHVLRSGTIRGNNIQVSGVFVVPFVEGISIIQNSFTANGTVNGNKITLTGSGTATGTYEGMSGSCTGTDTAIFTRSGSSLVAKEMEEIKAIRPPSRLFQNDALKMFKIITP